MVARMMTSAVAALLAVSAFGQEGFVVRDCTVVYEEAFAKTQGDAWGRDAARDLSEMLSKVTASTVKAYPESKAPANPGRVIYLGRCEASKDLDTSAYSPCEFRVKVTPERVFLLGRTETAASYAMTEFIERFCGYKFLSQNGENPYDVKPDLSVAPCDFTRRPAIEYRRIYRGYVNGWLGVKDMPKTTRNFMQFQRQRRCRLPDRDYEAEFRCRRLMQADCHLIYQYLHPDKYFKDHPEWYSMDRSGNRCNLVNAGCQLCYSNMEMRDEFAKNLIALIDADKAANPTNYERLYDMGQGDSCTRLCFCPNCSKIVEKYNRVKGGNWEGGDCALQLDFANDIAARVHAKHPEIKLRIFAYVSSEERPKAIKPAPGVIPWFCDLYTFSDHMLPLEHPLNKVKLDNLRDWCKVSEYVKIWDYMLYGTTPEVNVDAIAADARLYKRLGIKDVFMETEFKYQPFYDLHMYLLSELYFDPDQDPEKLIDTWVRVYGKAAPKMREAIEYIRMLERDYPPEDLSMWHSRRLPWYTADKLEKFRSLCLEAYAMDDSPSVRQRIAIAISGVDGRLFDIYRCIYGKDELAAARFKENKWATKEWATYEVSDNPAQKADIEKRIDERMSVYTLRFSQLPDELKDVPPADLKCLDWHGKYLCFTNNDESRLEDDPDSETGKAVVKRFTRPGAKLMLPIKGGVYDNLLKKVLMPAQVDVTPEKRDGKYHWYRLGKVTIDRASKLWLFPGWGFQCLFHDSYTICDGAAEEINTFEIWISVKVPEASEEVFIDRMCLRRVGSAK